MDRYQRVERPRPESAINENEIRITTQGLIRNYISYATSLLVVSDLEPSLFAFLSLFDSNMYLVFGFSSLICEL